VRAPCAAPHNREPEATLRQQRAQAGSTLNLAPQPKTLGNSHCPYRL